MLRIMRKFACVVAVVLLAAASPSRAWSTKEHIQLTRIAAERLIADEKTPPAMKDWLRAGTPGATDMAGERRWFVEQRMGIVPRGADGIPYWAVVPDMVVLMEAKEEKKIAPFNVPERLLHYIDL